MVGEPKQRNLFEKALLYTTFGMASSSYQDQGRDKEAEPLLQRALAISDNLSPTQKR